MSTTSNTTAATLRALQLEEKDFLDLLREAIGNSEKLQNYPPTKNPQEDLVADMVLRYLAPYSKENGGVLEVRKVNYVAGRGNVIITYKGTEEGKVVSFIGSHMDVVPANPEEWSRDPFSLTVEGDKLYGRGVTDCLGHVCVFANFFKQLAITKPTLRHTVVGVFIANEEASEHVGVGIDELEKQGELQHLKQGPVVWVDSANFGPTLGTGGVVGWELNIKGKRFHSGLPHKAINPIELAMEVVKYLQDRFFADFQKFAEEEKEYLFNTGSSLKPTQISTPPGSLNQIPGDVTVAGDIRFTPFYSGAEVKARIEAYLAELDISTLPTRGASRYELPDEGLKGVVTLKWLGEPYEGVAVNRKSAGYKALHYGVEKARGEAKPFSLTGSLPIIRDLQNSGFDVVVTGFGALEAYHAVDEFGLLSAFKDGLRVAANLVEYLELDGQVE